MSCQERRLQITSLLDGALGAEGPELEAHLRTCPKCASFLRELREVDDLVRKEALDLEPPPGLWRAIEARIAPQPVPWRERLAAGFVELFQLPELRHALAGLLLLALSSTSLLYVKQDLDEGLLEQARNYELEVEGNPFLPNLPSSNPFLDTAGDSGNPFEIAGSRR